MTDSLSPSAVSDGRTAVRPAPTAKPGILDRQLLDGLPLAVALEGVDGRLAWANKGFERISGIDRRYAVGADLADFVAHDDRAGFGEFRRNARAGAKAVSEFRSVRSDGEELWLHVTAVRIVEDGQVVIVYTGEDVSPTRTAQRARDAADRRYRDLVETSPDLIWEAGAAGQWVFVNAASWDLYGMAPAGMVGTPVAGRVADGVGPLDPVARILAGETIEDVEARHQDAGGLIRYLSFSGAPICAADGSVIGARGSAREIAPPVSTDVSVELERRLSLLRSLVNGTPDLIYYKDPSGAYQGCNPAFEEFMGIPEHELIGKRAEDLFDAERAARFNESDRRTLETGEPGKFEEWVAYPNGRRVLLEVIKVALTAESGENLGLIGVGRDATDRALAQRGLEEMAEHAERGTRLKSAFLANMSHEIRTPMNGVLGMTELLLSTDLDPHQLQSARLIQSSAESLLRILDDILDFSKIEAGQMLLEETSFDLWRVLDGAVRVLAVKAAERGTELLIDIRPEVPRWVLGDPVRLGQVVTNLVSNAVKFTEGGEVVLTATVEGTVDGASTVRVAVRDTGVGIQPDKLESIFAEFQQADLSTTRKYGGTGLGLAISRRIVELMGGKLEVLSITGAGSEFYFALPMRVNQPAEGSQRSADASMLKNRRVLVVDDHMLNRRIARGFLESAGTEVHEAESAMEGLAALQHGVESGKPFDAALIDYLMPEVDGFDLLERISADPLLAGVPVVILTSAARPDHASRAQALGVEYMTKPIARTELIEGLSRALQTSPGRSATRGASVTTATHAVRILLAEDNHVNQMVARSLLERRGHAVTVVSDGEQAVAAVMTGAFDLVLMDLRMPVLDGFGATAQIRGLPGIGDIPIVALTANALDEERTRCIEAGVDAFVAKPFKPEELFRTIEELVRKGAPDADSAPETPPVQIERFRALMREAGVESIVEDTLRVYLAETPARIEQVAVAAAKGDAKTLESVTHAMRSASLNIWAVDFAKVLEEVERASARGETERGHALMGRMRLEFGRVADYLAQELS